MIRPTTARQGLVLFALTALAGAGWGCGTSVDAAAAPSSHVVLSDPYTIDRPYRSMTGPYGTQAIQLGDVEGDAEELIWITGYRAEMIDGEGAPQKQEFMCHSNLDIDVGSHRAKLATTSSFSPRLFTLSQGQLEIRFPPGFGIPLSSSETLSLTTQVLNLNHLGDPLVVRHRVTVDYVRDADRDGPMVPLFPIGAYGLALLEGEDGYFGVEEPQDTMHGPGCLPGESASEHAYEDGLGRTFTGHWVVPPGRQVNRTLVTHLMRVPFDTTIHAIAVHLHPFAESLELRDLTTGTTVFRSGTEGFEDRIGLARVDAFGSAEGLPVYRDHEYEMVSVYENTTDEPQDSMAVMYLYLRDLQLEAELDRERRRLARRASRHRSEGGGQRAGTGSGPSP